MRAKRIMVKLSLPMQVSLDVLAERMGLSPATVAFMRLREALQRTADTEYVQQRIAALKAQSNHDDWVHDQNMAAEQLSLEGVQGDGEETRPRAQGE